MTWQPLALEPTPTREPWMAWRIVSTDYDDGGLYVDPGNWWDFCKDCSEDFSNWEATGHTYCGCGTWQYYEVPR